ncbi:hypothetical protein LCGC14_0695570 [marine sediment metagenome]|uniref:Uncharacterized protein n=1 Tax=marine sediment metagenome TaxID=412755 RepID=A0A0F9QP38_9ZZZZ|nr:MAG: hypothetical protein Lokiarch_10410 [Candidatus Lokiarchaeum sp. GC14_75]
MEKQRNKKFIVPIVLLASIYSGLIYNFLLLKDRSSLESLGSLFTSGASLSNVFALTFIIFTLILLLSIKYVDKITFKL